MTLSRRETVAMEQSTESELLAAIQGAEDPAMRAILMIQLKMLRDVSGMFGALSKQIQEFMVDEKRISEMVLNGGAATHTDEHHWQREFRVEWESLRPVMNMMRDRHAKGGYCDYAKEMVNARSEDAKSKRNIRDDLITKFIWGAFILTIGAFVGKYL